MANNFHSPAVPRQGITSIYYHKVSFKEFHLIGPYTVSTNIQGYSLSANHLGDRNRVIQLSITGMLTIPHDFVWNGPTGSFNFDFLMRGSCIHDALYELFNSKNHKELHDELKLQADLELFRVCIEDGASPITAWAVYNIVKVGSQFSED